MRKPTIIRGVTYPSRAAAGRALGTSMSAISHAAREGRLERVGLDPEHAQCKPTEIRGTVHASQTEAAKAEGVSRNTISLAARGGWLDQVGLGRHVAPPPPPAPARFKVVPRAHGILAVHDRERDKDVWQGRHLADAVQEAKRRAMR